MKSQIFSALSTLLLVGQFAFAQAPPPPSTAPAAPQEQAPPPQGNVKQAGHEADLAYSNPACTTAQPCDLKIYRAQCDNVTTCPSYIYSPGSFKALDMSALQTSITTTGSSWTYADTDSALTDNTAYSWVSTATFRSSPTMVSGPSTPFQGQIPALPSTVAPPSPTTGQCKIVR